MMEQQTALKNNEMQEKWKTCVKTTCYVYKVVERFKETIENLYDMVRAIINSLVESFKTIAKSVSQVFSSLRDFVDKHEDFIKYMKDYKEDYPQDYPQYVNNIKVNTTGFPRPIGYCVRSRC